MKESITPNSMTASMTVREEDLARLGRLVEGLVDSDLLLPEDGGALLEAIEAARQSLADGNAEAASGHARRFVQAIEALIRSDALDMANGHAVIETLRGILAEDAAGAA